MDSPPATCAPGRGTTGEGSCRWMLRKITQESSAGSSPLPSSPYCPQQSALWSWLPCFSAEGLCSLCISRSPNTAAPSSPRLPDRDRNREGDKDVTAVFDNRPAGGGRVWTWLANRRATPGPAQLSSPVPTAPVENHYTLDEAYTAVGEALYAELDRDSSNSPAYQNTAYNGSDTDPDAPASSAPSSAYYSDLSCATAPDRTYEAVGMVVGSSSGGSWEGCDMALRRQPTPRLASITETITVPSDYV